MNIRSKLVFSRPRVAAFALAAALLSGGATSASAQWLFNWDNALPPMQVERMVQASGYRLTGPVMRHGPVYLANVLGRENDRERLVIDARDGRLLQRYGAPATRRQYALSGDWSGQPGPQGSPGDDLFDRQDGFPPPRPPADVYGDAQDGPLRDAPLVTAPPAPRPDARPSGQVARTDDPSIPYIIPAPPAAAHAPALEKPKLKQQVRRKKPEPTPVAQPAMAPADGKSTTTAVAQPTANPSAPADHPAAITPNVSAPAKPKTDSASEPVAAAPRVAAAKPAAAPETAPAPPAAPPPKAAQSKPALNDVPVAPLE